MPGLAATELFSMGCTNIDVSERAESLAKIENLVAGNLVVKKEKRAGNVEYGREVSLGRLAGLKDWHDLEDV